MKGIVRFIQENKPYPHADESVLHYLVCTENRDFESAIRCLRRAVREWHGISRVALGVSSATFLISLLSAASGVGAWVALALVSTVFTGTQAWGSRRECQVREKELELLKSHPELLELMHQAYSKGVPPLKLVHSYNAIVGAFDTESGMCQGTMPVQAFAGQMQGAIATAKEVHQALGQLDVASLPESKLYPHLTDSKPSLPPIEPAPLPPQPQDKPVETAKPADSTMNDSLRDSSDERTPASTPSASVPTTNSQSPTPSTNKWINNFVSQTALIWGNQGSGKSWMARYIAKLKKDKGYRVVVLDPDSNRAEWQGIESYHDFEEIAEFLDWYVKELMARYKAFNASNMTEDEWRAKLWADGKAIALICEEVTTYVDLIEDKELLTQFFRLGLTKSRKQEMPLTFVSHNNNQTALGGIKGLANLIDKMLQLELQTDIDAETLQPVASGKGAVKLDGSNQWVPVTLPQLEKKITNFGDVQPEPVERSADIPERSEKPLNVAEPEEVERLNALINKPLGDLELPEPHGAEPLNLDPFSPEITSQERGSVVTFRRSGRSKEETIFLVWGAKKGGNKAYVAAREKLDRILSESGLD